MTKRDGASRSGEIVRGEGGQARAVGGGEFRGVVLIVILA